MNDLIVSMIRTWVPVLVGWLVTTLGLDVDSASTAAALVAALSAGYYLVVRVVEQRWAPAGWLLGRKAPPTY